MHDLFNTTVALIGELSRLAVLLLHLACTFLFVFFMIVCV